MHARLIVFLLGLLFAVLGNLRQLWPQIAFKQRRTQDESVWWLQKSALLRRCVPKGALETAQALLLTVCKKNVGSKSMIKKMRAFQLGVAHPVPLMNQPCFTRLGALIGVA